MRGQLEFANGVLVVAAALLHDRKRPAYRAAEFEVAQHDHRVAQVADVERRIHRADQPVLGEYEDGEHALLPEIGQQFVHLQDEEAFIRHRREIAVETVDDDDTGAVVLDAGPYGRGELSRRELGRIDLLEAQLFGLQRLFERQADRARPGFECATPLVEGEVRGVFAAQIDENALTNGV